MKWKNRGHEYDAVYDNITKKSEYYLFGAGDYGKQFLSIMENEINITGYIDNSPQKQNTVVNGYNCYSLQDIEITDHKGIIITMSQIARVQPVRQLEQMGFIKDKDFFIVEEFLSIYNVYKYDRVYFSTISFLPSTACNLKCKNCLNFNPYAKSFYVRDMENIKRDIDLFFKCVDRVMLFHVSGGEPMLYKHIVDVIEYLNEKYGHRIDTIRTVTNGTIVPQDGILQRLSKYDIEITVDDYREAVPQYKENFAKLVDKLNEYKIKHYINHVDSWIDLAPDKTDYSRLTEEKLIKHRDECNQSWEELRDGKIYSCNYAAYATVAGIAGNEDIEEAYDLTHFSEENKKELVEFRLGYSKKGYTNFCKKCRGFTPSNDVSVKVAEQVEV